MHKRYITTFALSLVLATAVAGLSCKAERSRVTVQNEEPPDTGQQLSATVTMNDPKTAAQLTSGFYALENNAWRWTAGKFSVQLRAPLVAQNGATVSFSFSLPEGVIQKLKTVRLSASINGTELKSQEFNSAGPQIFTADVPASLLSGPSVKVDFAVNKTFRPDGDARELALIANSVTLNPK